MSSVSPCGRYEWTGETKEVDGVTVGRYRAKGNVPAEAFPCSIIPGTTLGFIDGWKAVQHGGAVYGVSIDSRLFGDSICAGTAKHSELDKRCIIGRRALVEWSHITDDVVVSGGASVYNVNAFGNAIFGEGCTVSHIGDGELYVSSRVPGRASINLSEHILTVETMTTLDMTATLYRATDGSPRVEMGCLDSTLSELEELFMRDKWVETGGVDCDRLRPEMLAMVEMFKARVERW